MESITSSKVFATRQGTVLLGVIAAVIAAILVVVYVKHYRDSVNAKHADVPVLVAKKLIPQGTSGNVVGSSGLYAIAQRPRSEIVAGAFVDPASLQGKVALADINPGQQLTATDFGAPTNAVAVLLKKTERAVVVPLDSPGEIGGQVTAGDHVDVWVLLNAQLSDGSTRPIVREMMQNIFVMNAAGNGGNITIRATPKQAGELIYASANAKIWLALRPNNATNSKPPVISSNDLLGLRPLRIGG